MDIFKIFRGRGESYADLKRRAAAQSKTIKTQGKMMVQMSDDVLRVNVAYPPDSPDRQGTLYKTYDAQVQSLAKKADYCDDWGCQLVNSIAVLRAFFTVGGGYKIKVKDDARLAERTKKFVEQFFQHNDINGATCQRWGQEINIEGKFLGLMSPDTEDRAEFWGEDKEYEENPQIRIRLLPYTARSYDVTNEPNDYMKYIKVVFRDDKQKEFALSAEQFVYGRFGGRTGKVNESPPVMAAVLSELEGLGKALWDWRRINHLFASPLLVGEFEEAEDAQRWFEMVDAVNFIIGKAMAVTKGVLKYLTIPTESLKAVEDEITRLAQIISGATGVPIQFFGLADLLSNRSTADSLLEQVVAAVSGDRSVWKSVMDEAIRKAIIMANEKFNAGLNPYAVEVEIVELSSLVLHRLTQVYLPLALGKIIHPDTVREKVPGIDAEKEKEKMDALERELVEQEMEATGKLERIRAKEQDGKQPYAPRASTESRNQGLVA